MNRNFLLLAAPAAFLCACQAPQAVTPSNPAAPYALSATETAAIEHGVVAATSEGALLRDLQAGKREGITVCGWVSLKGGVGQLGYVPFIGTLTPAGGDLGQPAFLANAIGESESGEREVIARCHEAGLETFWYRTG